MSVLEIKDIRKTYKRRDRKINVLGGINLTVEKGTFNVIEGTNSDKYYSVEYKTDGSPHYEFVEKVSYKIDPNVDDATNKKRFEEHEKNEKNRRVLIKTDPIEE